MLVLCRCKYGYINGGHTKTWDPTSSNLDRHNVIIAPQVQYLKTLPPNSKAHNTFHGDWRMSWKWFPLQLGTTTICSQNKERIKNFLESSSLLTFVEGIYSQEYLHAHKNQALTHVRITHTYIYIYIHIQRWYWKILLFCLFYSGKARWTWVPI